MSASTTLMIAAIGKIILMNIILPLFVGLILMLLERWFHLSERVVKKSSREEKFIDQIFINGSNNKVIIGTSKGYSKDGQGEIDPMSPPKDPKQNEQNSLLTPNQQAICDDMQRISSRYTSDSHDCRNEYEEIERLLNTGSVPLAAGKFFTLFDYVCSTFEKIHAIQGRAGEQITFLRNLLAGLDQLLGDESSSNDILIRHMGNCETAALRVIRHIPLVYGSN